MIGLRRRKEHRSRDLKVNEPFLLHHECLDTQFLIVLTYGSHICFQEHKKRRILGIQVRKLSPKIQIFSLGHFESLLNPYQMHIFQGSILNLKPNLDPDTGFGECVCVCIRNLCFFINSIVFKESYFAARGRISVSANSNRQIKFKHAFQISIRS